MEGQGLLYTKNFYWFSSLVLYAYEQWKEIHFLTKTNVTIPLWCSRCALSSFGGCYDDFPACFRSVTDCWKFLCPLLTSFHCYWVQVILLLTRNSSIKKPETSLEIRPGGNKLYGSKCSTLLSKMSQRSGKINSYLGKMHIYSLLRISSSVFINLFHLSRLGRQIVHHSQTV